MIRVHKVSVLQVGGCNACSARVGEVFSIEVGRRSLSQIRLCAACKAKLEAELAGAA